MLGCGAYAWRRVVVMVSSFQLGVQVTVERGFGGSREAIKGCGGTSAEFDAGHEFGFASD
jgi:hypothetical protein